MERDMANLLLDPFTRLFCRWRTERAVSHLDARLIEDAGIEIKKNPWDDLSIAKRGYWSGRVEK